MTGLPQSAERALFGVMQRRTEIADFAATPDEKRVLSDIRVELGSVAYCIETTGRTYDECAADAAQIGRHLRRHNLLDAYACAVEMAKMQGPVPQHLFLYRAA